jgi:leader peptidase (prepilin peptidase)/N-methyltransferase
VTSRPALRRTRLLPALAITPVLRWAIAVHAVTDDEPWRSACTCGHALRPAAAAPSGRCTGCGQRIGAPPYAVEAAALVAAIALMQFGQHGWALAAYAWWIATMIVLAFVDLAALLLPLRISAVSAAGFLGVLAATGDGPSWRRAAIAAAVLAALLAVLAVAARGQLGWGDVGFMLPFAAALGWESWRSVFAGVLLGFVSAALFAITRRLIGHRPPGAPLPLGPFLIASAITVLAWP